MNKTYLTILLFSCLIVLFTFSDVIAQEPFSDVPKENSQAPVPNRPNLLRELNLSNDQIKQIRRINQERRPIAQEAQRKLKAANEALDAAVYSDNENDAEVQTRLKEVNAAQLEVLRNRTITEQSIRRLLTSEQLVKFRTLRQQFREMKAENPNNVKNPNAPANQQRNLRLKRFGNRPFNRQIQ